jgi:hypothetical protein
VFSVFAKCQPIVTCNNVVEGESSHPLRLAKHFRGASVELALSGLKENRQMNDAKISAVLFTSMEPQIRQG